MPAIVHRVRRMPARLPATALLVLVSVLVFSPARPALADGSADGLMVCPVANYTQNYDPPLGPVRQDVEVSAAGSVTTCEPNSLGIVGGTLKVIGSGELDCVLGGTTEGTIVFKWNTGAVTVVEYPTVSVSLRPVGQTVNIVLGEVVDGPFEGGTMVLTSTLITVDALACLSGQLDAVGGPATVSFADL